MIVVKFRTNLAAKHFDKSQQVIVSLERLVLEAICFDFRVRYPLEKAIKLMKKVMSKDEAISQDDPKNIYAVIWEMSFDMYKTYMPLKNTEFGMAYSMFELATRLIGNHGDKLAKIEPKDQGVPRMRILQGLKDLLELYTQYQKHTKVGLMFDLEKFLQIKIEVNKEIEDAGALGLPKCNEPLPSTDDLHAIPFSGSASSVTNRFVFDVEEARREQGIVKGYFEDQYEEVEVEIEEEIPEPAPDRPRDRRGHGGHGNNYRGGGRGGHNHSHGHPHGGHPNQDRHGHDGWGGRRNDRNRRGGRGGGPY